MRASSKRDWYSILRFSRLELSILVSSLTVASSEVLVDEVVWPVVFIVGLSTYVVYNLDNLLDWPSEKHALGAFSKNWKTYTLWCVPTILLSLFGIATFAIHSTPSFLLLLAILGTLGVGYVWMTRRPKDRPWMALLAEQIVDALVWSLVVALLPVVYVGHPLTPQVLMAIAYMWQLCWVGTAIWNLTYTVAYLSPELHRTPTLTQKLGENQLIRLAVTVSLTALVLAVVDVCLGYFPWYNLAVVSGPAVNLILLSVWPRSRNRPELFGSIFYGANTVCGLTVWLAYYLAK